MEEQPIASTSSVANESPELQMPELMPEVSTELPVVAGTVDTVEGRCLTTDLREFCLRAKLSLTTAKDLFQVLRHYHPELPNDPRTLLQTPRTCVSKSLKRGKYVHLGLERGLLDELRLCPLTGIPEVRVQLHIDGMKVFKASAQCLWPILARVNHPVVGQPFVVGVFCGFGKPEPLEDFLGDCVSELKCLLTTGLRDPRTESVIKVNLLNVICDTPARCYVRQVKAHNGYYGCDRHIRKLSSDSDDEDSPHQPTEPTGWPAPPPILQHSTTISSYVSTATISTEFSQQVQKDMADIKGQLVNTNVRLAALEKRNDFLAEQLMALNSSVQQMQETLSDVVNALQRASSAGSVTSSSLNLPLCTEEAYENFLRRLSVEDGFANEASNILYKVVNCEPHMGSIFSTTKSSSSRSQKRKHSSPTGEDDTSPIRKRIRSTYEYVYRELFCKGEGSDIIVSALGYEWLLHRIYIKQSPFFAAMLDGGWKESDCNRIELELSDPAITKHALDVVFGSFYCDCVSLTDQTVLNILAAATWFHLEDIRQSCNDFLKREIRLDTVIEFHAVSGKYSLPELNQACVDWLAKKLLVIPDSPALFTLLQNIPTSLMQTVVSHPRLVVIQLEQDVFICLLKAPVARYCQHDSGDERGDWESQITRLRVPHPRQGSHYMCQATVGTIVA
ncbi:Germ cell-less protein-like 1 [Sparganum proliferum]